MTSAEIVSEARKIKGQKYRPYRRGPRETDCVGVLVQVFGALGGLPENYRPPIYSSPPQRELFEAELPKFFNEVGWDDRREGDVLVLVEPLMPSQIEQGAVAQPRHCLIYAKNVYGEQAIGLSEYPGNPYVVEGPLTDEMKARVWRTLRHRDATE